MGEAGGTELPGVAGRHPEGDMQRRRGRTIGTFVIGAIVVGAFVYLAFGGARSTTMPGPHVIGAAEPSQR